jgi:type IV fimbrial biogenesis protein FimT
MYGIIRPKSRRAGFGLIEMLVALTIAGILIGWAVPGFSRLLQDLEGERRIHALRAAVQLARTEAVYRGVPTTICPLDRNGRCDGEWSRGWTVFRDPERSSRLAGAEAVIRRFEGVAEAARLHLRAFGTTRYFRMLPNGQTDWQNGRFVYCPPPARKLRVRALVINVQGRARIRPPRKADPACDQ